MRILAGTPPGGGQDRTARALEMVLEGPIEVVNVPGRGGGNAWEELFDHQADWDICAVSSPTLITNRILGESAIDDRDLTSLAVLYSEYTLALTRSDSGLSDPDSLWRALDSGRLEVAFATAIGNINHLVLAAVCQHIGVRLEGIPLRIHDSARAVIADLVARSADVALVSVASARPEIESGEVSPVFVSAPSPVSLESVLVPTLGELGVDCTLGMWRGLVGPPGMAGEAVAAWDQWLAAATASATWQDLLVRNSWTGTYADSSASTGFLHQQRSVLASLLESAGVIDG